MTSRHHALFAIFGIFFLTGCSGFVSKPIAPIVGNDNPKPAEDGIYYYMPTAPIMVQVALDKDKNKTITIPAVSAVPDRSKPYLLTVPDNFISENHATLTVGPNGLLQAAATAETSGVDTLIKSAATSLGTISAVAAHVPFEAALQRPASPEPPCQSSTTYTRLIDPEKISDVRPICDLSVKIVKLGGNSPLAPSDKANIYGVEQSGIFYKTQIPYLITVGPKDSTDGQSFIALSPNEAPVQFLPLKKAMFANNTTTFTLTDGILTKADSDVGGEITGFVALPADAIGAYFTAFGNLFTSFKASSSNASAAALANAQWQLCKAAITANPIQGVSPAQATTNYAAIKSACGG